MPLSMQHPIKQSKFAAAKNATKIIPAIISSVSGRGVFSAGNRNRTLAVLVSMTAFVLLSEQPEIAICSANCRGLFHVCDMSWSRRLSSCRSNDSNDDEPDVDLPGVVTTDFSGDRLLTSTDVTPLTNVKSGSSVIPVSLSESFYNIKQL